MSYHKDDHDVPTQNYIKKQHVDYRVHYVVFYAALKRPAINEYYEMTKVLNKMTNVLNERIKVRSTSITQNMIPQNKR